MSDLPLDETALQAATEGVVAQHRLFMKEPGRALVDQARVIARKAISTYLKKAEFKVEEQHKTISAKHGLPDPEQRLVGPWVPVAQGGPPNNLPIYTKVQSKNWAKSYGHVVGWDEDLQMVIVRWDGTADHGPEACEPQEFEVIQ